MLQTKLELFQYPNQYYENCDQCGSFDDCYFMLGCAILCVDCREQKGYNRISEEDMLKAKVPDGFGA